MHYNTEAEQADIKQVALKQLASLMGMGLATGAGYRALHGLGDMFRSREIPPYPSNHIPYLMPVSRVKIPQQDEEAQLPKTPSLLRSGIPKLANAPVAPAAPAAPAAPQEPGMLAKMFKNLSQYLPDTHTLKPLANEWGMPAATAAAGVGLYGGYKGVDWLMDQERKQRSQQELEEARNEYSNIGHLAMQARNRHPQLTPEMQQQYASLLSDADSGLMKLSESYVSDAAEVEAENTGDQPMEKQAILLSMLQKYLPWLDSKYQDVVGGYDNWQGIKGGVNTAAMLAALGSGGVAYNWAKGQNHSTLLQQALSRRQAARQQLSPPPIMAMPEDDPYAPHAA